MTPGFYTNLLINLLPSGRLWDGLATLKKALEAWAEEFARVHGRMLDLVKEADPLQATETLDEWECDYGLPEAGMPVATTISGRQHAVLAKRVNIGGQSIQDYVTLGAALGYTVTITEFRPFTTESTCDDLLYDLGWAYTWQVNVLTAPEGRFVDGHCLDLEAVFKATGQSHLDVCFNYAALES